MMLKNITRTFFIIIRNLETLTAKYLKYSKFGEPAEVLELAEEKIDAPKNNEVIVKILAAPINPSDINTIQGRYPIKPKTFPATGGNECVGEILQVGPNVKELKSGDRVINSTAGLGTWRTIGKYTEKDLMKISNKIDIVQAATLTVNPCTAYRMLKDFVKLQPGDTVIQNGANSAVGQAVHQLCKFWDLQSVGIIRDRANVCDTKTYLKNLGASEVLIEEQVRHTELFQTKLPRPKLGLNCIGGKNANNLIRHLDMNGVLVTYGGMSRKPVIVPTALMIFQDISFRGFWVSRWTKQHMKNPKRKRMLDDLCELIECGAFKAPAHELVSLHKYDTIAEKALNLKGFRDKKYIFTMH